MSSAVHHAEGSEHVLKTPIWMTVIRGFQFLVSLIIVGLAGRLMHDAYLDEHGLALATSLITWVVVAYVVVTEKFSGARAAYHVIAVLSLDGFLVILWLATFAATAAKRAAFIYDVDVDSCYSDGSLINSKTCFTKRSVILFESGLAMMAAIAGLGALVWLLFIATFAWGMTMFFRGRKEGRFMFTTGSNDHQLETQAHAPQTTVVGGEKIVTSPQQQPIQPQTTGPYQPPVAGTYPPQGQHAQDQFPQGQYPQTGYQPPMSPSPVSAHYQAPHIQSHELHVRQPEPQQQQQYGQQPYQAGYIQSQELHVQKPEQQQYNYAHYRPQQGYGHQQHTQQTTSPNASELAHTTSPNSSELDGGHVQQHYEMPSPPAQQEQQRD